MDPPGIIGTTSTPDAMTGFIPGGASVTQAVRLQMILMFLIFSIVVLSSIVVAGFALMTLTDEDH